MQDPKNYSVAGSRVQLCCDIILDHFGELVHTVATALLKRGRMTVPQLLEMTKMPENQVRNSLLILIQQNLVGFIEEFEEGNRDNTITYYHVLVQEVLWRIRYPRFLVVARKVFGPDGEIITQLLLEHGRLTKEEILSHAAHVASVALFDDKQLMSMIRNRFIVRVPDAPPPAPAMDLTAALKVSLPKAGKKKGSDDEDDDDPFPSAPKAGGSNLAEAFRGTTKRKATPKKLPSRQRLKKANTGENGEKEKEKEKEKDMPNNVLFEPNGLSTSMDVDQEEEEDEEVFWRISCPRFNSYFRHEACIALTSEKLDHVAGSLVRTMIKMVEPFMQSSKDETSVTITLDGLYDKIQEMGTPELESLSKDTIKQYLLTMAQDQAQMVNVTSENPTFSFVVNLGKMSRVLQTKMIESVVKDRFGPVGLRIFKLLIIKKQLEQKQIADLALIQLKDARERLYKMFEAGYVLLQEVPRSQDHAPSRTFYLWSVRPEPLVEEVCGEMYKTLRNLRIRMKHEGERSGDLNRPENELSNEDLHKLFNRIEASILHIDHSLMVLKDFC